MGVEKAHDGVVNTLCNSSDLKLLYSAGNDGVINVWGPGFKKLYSLSVSPDDCLIPKIRSICVLSENRLAVGTRSSEIVEFTDRKAKILIRGHFDKELWGMDTDR